MPVKAGGTMVNNFGQDRFLNPGKFTHNLTNKAQASKSPKKS